MPSSAGSRQSTSRIRRVQHNFGADPEVVHSEFNPAVMREVIFGMYAFESFLPNSMGLPQVRLEVVRQPFRGEEPFS
jgi:hypothetical protein